MTIQVVSLRRGPAAAARAACRACSAEQFPSQCQPTPQWYRLRQTQRRAATSASIPTQPNRKQEKAAAAAAEQRRILADLRGAAGQASSGGAAAQSVTGRAGRTQADDLRAAAEAALRGGQSGAGPMSLGMMGDTATRMPSRPSRTDRWSGEGKAWKDLSGSQKVARTTVFSSRLIFITGGAALTLVLAYALATELLAKNSPTVVYGEACKLVQESPEVKQHLLPPFTFHTSYSSYLEPGADTSALPPGRRRRNRNVSAAVMSDARTGEDVMLVRFFVGARDKDRDLTLWQRTRQGVIDGAAWARERIEAAWYDVRGQWAGPEEEEQQAAEGGAWTLLGGNGGAAKAQHAEPPRPEDSSGGILAGTGRMLSGVLGSFVGLTRGQGDAVRSAAESRLEPGTWSSGEVHGELHKDERGVFQFKRLFVDVPSSSSLVRRRVWIVRNGDEVKR